MNILKIWVDDVRPAPEGYIWCKSVLDAISCIGLFEQNVFARQWQLDTAKFPQLHSGLKLVPENIKKDMEYEKIELIDIDHDAGEYASEGGDYIKLLDWLEETGRNYPIHIHTNNPVGAENMRRIIYKNGWTEV